MADDNSRILEIQKLNKAIDRRNKTVKKWREKHERLKERFDWYANEYEELKFRMDGLEK